MRQMNESVEALRKQNEDLATRLTAAEGLNNRRDEDRERRHAREQEQIDRRTRERERTERRKRIHRKKHPAGQEELVHFARDSHHTSIQNCDRPHNEREPRASANNESRHSRHNRDDHWENERSRQTRHTRDSHPNRSSHDSLAIPAQRSIVKLWMRRWRKCKKPWPSK
jgi:hypothetical protein